MTTPVDGINANQAVYTPQAAAPTANTANTANSSSGASNSLLDPQSFLQLLVAQLQYQDPTNPTDTSTFMNQTAMLSQVQTMNSMSTTLSSLADAQQAQSATGMIGKQVTYLDGNGMRVAGVVSAASLLSTGATLRVGATDVPLANVVEVAMPSS